MSLKDNFSEYTVEISPKYINHFMFVLDYFDKQSFYEIISTKSILDNMIQHGFRLPVKVPYPIIRKFVKTIRKLPHTNYFLSADCRGYMKINETEDGLKWRQSMVERIASMQSLIRAFDKKFNYSEPKNEESNLQLLSL